MPPPNTQERGTPDRTRSGPRRRIHSPRCRRQYFTVPGSYGAFEQMIRRWIATCVCSRTMTRRGLPCRREEELIPRNPNSRNQSLVRLWNRIKGFTSQRIEVGAEYIWGEHHVDEIEFDLLSPQIHDFREGADVGGRRPPRPQQEDTPDRPTLRDPRPSTRQSPPPTSLPGALWQGATMNIRGYARSISNAQAISEWGAEAIGYCDTHGRYVSSLPENPGSSYVPRIPLPAIDSRARNLATTTIPSRLRGYRQGWDAANNQVRNLDRERTTPARGPRPLRPSTRYLIYLRSRYGRTRQAVRDGMIRDFFPELGQDYRRWLSGAQQ